MCGPFGMSQEVHTYIASILCKNMSKCYNYFAKSTNPDRYVDIGIGRYVNYYSILKSVHCTNFLKNLDLQLFSTLIATKKLTLTHTLQYEKANSAGCIDTTT